MSPSCATGATSKSQAIAPRLRNKSPYFPFNYICIKGFYVVKYQKVMQLSTSRQECLRLLFGIFLEPAIPAVYLIDIRAVPAI
jgi:hypothetical protein